MLLTNVRLGQTRTDVFARAWSQAALHETMGSSDKFLHRSAWHMERLRYATAGHVAGVDVHPGAERLVLSRGCHKSEVGKLGGVRQRSVR